MKILFYSLTAIIFFLTASTTNAQAPTCSVSATPTSIGPGESTTLTWTSQNAVRGLLSPSVGIVDVSGRQTFYPDVTTTYRLLVMSDTNQSTECNVVVNVAASPTAPSCILSASPNPVEAGQSARLTWTAENAVRASIDQGIGTVWHFGGNKEVSPTVTTFYTLTVVGDLGQTAECQAMLEVSNPTTSGGSTFTPSRFIPCEGKGCSACNLVEMANTLIVWLFGIIFLIFAILMTVAGFGLVTSGGNTSALSSAKDKFTNAMIGLVIVMSAWLIVDTLMKGLLRGGTGEIEGWGPWSEVKCQVQTPTITPPPGGVGVEPVDPGDGSCPVTPLSPEPTDPVSVRLENGETVIWDGTDPQLRICAEKKGGRINSAFRPDAYQRHIYEVWHKWCRQGLKDNTTSACSATKSAVGEEMSHHGLSCSRLVAATASNHGSGRAVDISGAPHTNDHCLTWYGPGDDVHYTLQSGCTCNN